MSTKSKIALAAALFAATSSAALAQGFDPNLANRYPAYAGTETYGYVAGANTPARMHAAPHASLHSAPVRLRQGRDAALADDQIGSYVGQATEFDVDRGDRAASPYAGGGF